MYCHWSFYAGLNVEIRYCDFTGVAACGVLVEAREN